VTLLVAQVMLGYFEISSGLPGDLETTWSRERLLYMNGFSHFYLILFTEKTGH
jgi:hypothetical protein